MNIIRIVLKINIHYQKLTQHFSNTPSWQNTYLRYLYTKWLDILKSKQKTWMTDVPSPFSQCSGCGFTNTPDSWPLYADSVWVQLWWSSYVCGEFCEIRRIRFLSSVAYRQTCTYIDKADHSTNIMLFSIY